MIGFDKGIIHRALTFLGNYGCCFPTRKWNCEKHKVELWLLYQRTSWNIWGGAASEDKKPPKHHKLAFGSPFLSVWTIGGELCPTAAQSLYTSDGTFFLFPSIIFNINNTFISKYENMFCWVSIFSKINTFVCFFRFGYFGEWWILNRADFRLSSVIILKPETCQLFLPTFVLTWCHYSSILGNGISWITWWIIGALF